MGGGRRWRGGGLIWGRPTARLGSMTEWGSARDRSPNGSGEQSGAANSAFTAGESTSLHERKMRIRKEGVEIRTLDAWQQHAPPAAKRHWKRDRSALCMAGAWLAEAPPVAVRELLASHGDIGPLRYDDLVAEPECKIKFDRYGGPRQADIAFVANDHRGAVAVTVEGKADEPFDSYVGDVLANAVDRALDAPSNGVRRVEMLAASLLPTRAAGSEPRKLPPLRQVRYQLITAVAGTLAYARDAGANRAVLVVEEFVTRATKDHLHARNQRDLERFIARLTSGRYSVLPPGRLI